MKRYLFLFIFFPVLAAAQLKINEIMPKNVSAIMDDAYNYSMWVEIYNSSSANSYNLNAYYFTDDLSEPRKWKPLSRTVASKGYALLYFEREDRSGHASFKLDPDGGVLYLVDASSQIVDQVIYPAQYRNTSYGRKTDGDSEWGFFEHFTPGSSNNGKITASSRCPNPSFLTPGGFYSSAVDVRFTAPGALDTIYYTTDGREPTRSSMRYVPGSSFPATRTTVVRAKCFSYPKLPSEVASATFFIGERDFKLPVASIITDPANLFDNMIGIYCVGTNGSTEIGNPANGPCNYNQDWDRPANFELYDAGRTGRLNQEVDIAVKGNWSRANAQKSLAINPKKKHGENRLKYPEMFTARPDQKYKSILLRNSGNDFNNSQMRDGMMTVLIQHRTNLEYMAYEPAICFMNGEYYGIQNLRERSNKDLIYSNYGLSEEEIILVADWGYYGTDYQTMLNYITSNNLAQESTYNSVCEMMDVDNFIDYMLTEIYYANTDWPGKNIKAWKKRTNGKWRWILHDTDFGFSIWSDNYNHNTLEYVMNNNEAASRIFKGLLNNPGFKKKFLDRFVYHISTTFDADRVSYIIDSLASRISDEMAYHKPRWGSSDNFSSVVQRMKTYGNERPDYMMKYISDRFFGGVPFYTLSVSSNIPGATYQYNSYYVDMPKADLKVFSDQTATIAAQPVEGYKFKHWKMSMTDHETVIPYGSEWKYFDGNAMPAENWYASGYNDASWKTGRAQFGYGGKGEVTVIGYGGNASDKYPTSYYRKTFSIGDLSSSDRYTATVLADDGAAIYINGIEIGRVNLPAEPLSFSTYALGWNDGARAAFDVPVNILKKGINEIAIEVHQCNASSSDVIFDFELTTVLNSETDPVSNPVYSDIPYWNMNLRAIYEPVDVEDPDQNMRLVINEVVCDNTSVEDENGEFDAYIELYNDSAFDVDIAGWYISNRSDNKLLFRIPDSDMEKTKIPSKGYLILWADGQPEQGVLHLGFGLDKGGGTITLSKYNRLEDLITVDQVAFPALSQNISYSRVPDGSNDWVTQAPTFNKMNGWRVAVDSVENRSRLYPVWVDDRFTVENAGGKLLQIVDLTGKIILSKTLFLDIEGVEASFLQPGIYLVKVGDDSFKIRKK